VKQLSQSLFFVSSLFFLTSSLVYADADSYRPQERTEDCDICLERQDTVVSLPCHQSHKMCIPCILDWFVDRNHDACPTCRASVGQKVRGWLKGRDSVAAQQSRPSQQRPAARPQPQSNKCASCNATANDPIKLPCGHVMCLRHAWQKLLEAGDDVWPPLWCPLCSTPASWECMSELEQRAARAGLPRSGSQESQPRLQQWSQPIPRRVQPAPRPVQQAPRPVPHAHQQVDNCPICLNPVGQNGGEFVLSCRHKLCLNCAKANFLDHTNNSSCPLCRAYVDYATKQHLRSHFQTSASYSMNTCNQSSARQPSYSSGNNSGSYNGSLVQRAACAVRKAWRNCHRTDHDCQKGDRISPEVRIGAIVGIVAVGGICVGGILRTVTRPTRCCSAF